MFKFFAISVFTMIAFMFLSTADGLTNIKQVKLQSPFKVERFFKNVSNRSNISKLRDIVIKAVLTTVSYYVTTMILLCFIATMKNIFMLWFGVSNIVVIGVSYYANVLVASYFYVTIKNSFMLWFGVRKDAAIEYKHIQSMADDVSRYSSIPGKLRVYIANDSTINAHTGSILIRDPWIVINSGLVENLNNKEICGVIAHEVGHIKHSDVHREIIKLCLVQGICHLLDLSVKKQNFVLTLYRYFNRMLGHKQEYLADYHAAKIVGPRVAINVTKKIHRLHHKQTICTDW